MRKMFDSTTVADLPEGGDLYAGYMDGRYRTVDGLRQRFPKAKIVTITVLGTPRADVCDTEPGNIGPAGAARWAAAEVHAGRHPTLYAMASQWKTVKEEVEKQGITGKVSYWIADYDRDPTIPAGAVAKQYLHGDLKTIGSFAYSGGHFDVSNVADHWPGVDPPRRPRPLDVATRTAVRLVTHRLNKRHRPLTAKGRELLLACRTAINHALNVK